MIVKMSKITVLGMEDQRKSLISSLMDIGAVEVNQVDPGEYEDLAQNPEVQDEISAIGSRITEVSAALASLDKYCPEKKRMFSGRREMSSDEFSKMLEDENSIWDSVKYIREQEERLVQLKNEENRLSNLIASLIPWKDYEVDLDFSGTQKTVFLTGTIPAAIDIKGISDKLDEKAPYSEIDVIQSDKDQHYVAVVFHRDLEQDCLSALKTVGFNKVSFSGLTGMAQENISKINERLSQISEENESISERITAKAGSRRAMEALYDSLGMEQGRTEAVGRILKTKKAFMIKGWIPEGVAAKAKEMLETKYTVSVELEEPAPDEEFPVYLENRGLAEAGEPVSNMYSLPHSHEIDPNAVMTPFFVMFFGLMLSDGGYGIIMVLVAAFALWRLKLENTQRKFMKLIFFCGLSTIFWGFLFGSWFGIEALAKYGVWLNPVEEPELLLSWSLLFGVIHMYAGFALKAANLLRDKKYLDAILEVLPVYIFYTGFIMVLLPYVPKMDREAVAPLVQIGQYIFIGGAISMILTQGRSKKNIVGKLFGGVSSLYSVVGFMSDVLSYSRLLALGLATGIIASIINQMSAMFNIPLIIKLLLMTIILLIGHTINFAINALGAYVHSCRLQYLEFFGKFFTGGGKAFKPLRANTKYITVKQDAGV